MRHDSEFAGHSDLPQRSATSADFPSSTRPEYARSFFFFFFFVNSHLFIAQLIFFFFFLSFADPDNPGEYGVVPRHTVTQAPPHFTVFASESTTTTRTGVPPHRGWNTTGHQERRYNVHPHAQAYQDRQELPLYLNMPTAPTSANQALQERDRCLL
jgi:hypothetical protein